MAYICYKPAGSCKMCQHYRWDEDSNRMCCWAKVDEENNMLKDFSFVVQCNDGPAIKINTVAENRDRAEVYVKSMYASQYTTYADDRFNNWSIMEV